jgi:ectoine hydroxylase-related dioxygenase (phytanoyl-CoA dioxygenase family)
MAYRYSERHREEYYAAGLTVLRDLIPAALLSDLRSETDTAREIARREHGAQTQRLQPVYRYEELNHQPFRDFLALPELRAAVAGILGPEHTESDIMGVLFEPKEAAWATAWHRDWGYNVPGIDVDAFFDAALHKPQMFNQLNAALYDDHSLWVVPGSHARPDTDAERTVFGGQIPPPAPMVSPEMSPEQRELACLHYTRQMPGAVPVTLGAGDVAFYRAVGWHIGNYVPYTKRATLHDGFYGPDDRAWQANVPMAATKPAEAAPR